MKQLAARVPFEVPASLVEREIDRRLEEFARRLMEQKIDPRQAGIDWRAFRESQRDVAREAVAAALVLDEVGAARAARRRPRRKSSARSAGTPSGAVGRRRPCARALEKEGGLVARVRGAAPGEVD